MIMMQGLQWWYINLNRRDCYKTLLRKRIRCDYVITGTPKCARKHWPGSDTRCLRLPGHGDGVREVRGTKPGEATTLLLTLFCVRYVFSGSGARVNIMIMMQGSAVLVNQRYNH